MLDLSPLVEKIVDTALKEDVYTAIPALVVSVASYNKDQTVSVQPVLADRYKDGVTLIPDKLEGVPVVMPSAGNGILSFPVKEGDTVLLVFSMRSMDEWSDSDGKKAITPFNQRSHSLADAIAIAGLYTTKTHLSPNPTDVELKLLDDSGEQLSSVKLKPNGDVTVDAKGKLEATIEGNVVVDTQGDIEATSAGSATLKAPTITLDGNVSVTGTLGVTGATTTAAIAASSLAVSGALTQGGTNVGKTHIHGGVATGSGSTGGVS